MNAGPFRQTQSKLFIESVFGVTDYELLLISPEVIYWVLLYRIPRPQIESDSFLKNPPMVKTTKLHEIVCMYEFMRCHERYQ